jgi:hypothetical protein
MGGMGGMMGGMMGGIQMQLSYLQDDPQAKYSLRAT